jgi:hypothetical protein
MFGEALDPLRVECELWESGSRYGFLRGCWSEFRGGECVDFCVFLRFLGVFFLGIRSMRSCDGVCGHYVV